MKPIKLGELLDLAQYEAVREHFRSRVIADKKLRRVPVGPRASALFENRDTVMLQVQEMLRTERITRPDAVQHELDTYNELLAGPDELSCTLMIEIPDKDERDAFLVAAAGLERHVSLVGLGHRVAARSIDRGADPGRTTAVHYLKLALPSPLAQALRHAASEGARTATSSEARSGPVLPARAPTRLELVIDHPAYAAAAVLPAETLVALGQDLQGGATYPGAR